MIRLQQTPLVVIALLVALSIGSQAQVPSESTTQPNSNNPVNPLIFNAPPDPPNTGQPGRRSDAGSRGCVGQATIASELIPLLALVPMQETATTMVVFGKTATTHPTFWFYVPSRSASTATFVLQDQDGNPIYESNVTLPQTGGILSLTVPETVTPLAVGQPYQWFFKLYCRPDSPPDSFVDGWIQRASLSPDLAQQLASATLPEQVRLYAANGFWFEALSIAAELRQTDPEDTTWIELLRAIDLEEVADQAIAPL